MQNIYEILARAAALRDETQLNSISPERAGGIMYDTLLALNDLWLQQGGALVISKIYASVAAMEADTAPVSDLTGQPLRPGQIVVIASSDSDNGSVYRYNGTDSPSWSLVGEIGNLEPVDSLDSDSTQLPLAAHQGKVLDGKISQLGQYAAKELFPVNSPEYVEGSMTENGTINTSDTSYSMVAPIALAPGQTILLNSGNDTYLGADTAVVYRTDSNGNWQETLVTRDTYGGVSTTKVSYTNKTNATMYVGICTYKYQRHYIKEKILVSASKKEVIIGWILSESFSPQNVTYTDGLINSPFNVIWSDGVSGTITLIRNSDNFVVSIIATHDSDSYVITITRNSNDEVTNVSIQ